MVQVIPPPGWRPGQHLADEPQEQAEAAAKQKPSSGDRPAKPGASRPSRPPSAGGRAESAASGAGGKPIRPKPKPAAGLSTPATGFGQSVPTSEDGDLPVHIDPALLADTVDDFPELQRPQSERSAAARAARHAAPPPLPLAGAAAAALADGEMAEDLAMAPPPNWTSPAEALWRKWLILITAPLAGLVLAIGAIMMFSGGEKDPDDEVQVEAPATPDPEPEAKPDPQPDPLPVGLDPAWIPDATRMLFCVRAAQLDSQPDLGRLLDASVTPGRKDLERILSHFGLKWPSVARIYGASTDLGAWTDNAVFVIELQEGQDATAYDTRGEAIGLKLGGATCRQEPGGSWPHPFVAVGPRLLVTGNKDLLRRLADRSQPQLQSRPIRHMLDATAAGVDAAVMIDLAAARQSGWRLPTFLMDVWPAGKKPWRIAWEMPLGAGLALQVDDRVHTEVTLVCEAQTAADEVRAALEELIASGHAAVGEQIDALPAKIEGGRIKAQTAHQYETLLKQAQSALKTARCDVADASVSLRLQWQRSLADLAAAALDSRGAIESDWLAAARNADQQVQQRLLSGLVGYQRAEGAFPPGAAGGKLWKPDSRLSWIAMMLPYLGQREWHRQLDFGYSWNSKENSKITRQPLEAMINPALGPGKTEAGFPITHYVGVAGVGADAGELPADHPRAGVFGFGRRTRLEDISDGASNTIAVLGVSGRVGAWAAGGDPTVRPLTKAPFVNGPDGFGSGQPDGMLAGMADGSVRFISKDVDPRIVELLATARGGGDATVAALDTVPPIGPEPKVPKPAPKEPDPDKTADGPKPDPAELPVEPPKVELPKVDVPARLAAKVAAIDLPDVPLAKVIELVESYSGLPITLDIETMEQLGVSLSDPITFRLTDTTIGQVLEAALARRGLVYAVEGNYVLVTRPLQQRETLSQVRYSVSDLVGTDPDEPEVLAGLVVQLVAPESWQSAGGKGEIEVPDDVLVVRQTDLVHGQVLAFLEKLRNARGKRLRSQLDPELFALQTRADRAGPQLERPITANFIEPTPLPEIIPYLEELGQTTIVVDWLTLGSAGVWIDTKGTLKAEERPLGEALSGLLRPLGLAHRVAGAETIQITTSKALNSRLELEFYPVRDLINKDRTPETLLQQIKAQVAPTSWDEAGGSGILYFDPPGHCLIALQTQPIQAELEGLLNKWRREAKP